jgi:TonB-linked SusC/RagA family outer membrane protein
MLALPGAHAWSQATGQVTGSVTSTEGAPLAGASVSVNGQGALTNAQGRFTIPAVTSGTRTINAGLIGYSAQSRQISVVAGQTVTVNFQLSPSAVELEGVVAVGYGTARSQDVTGAVASVQAEAIEDMPVPGATQALAAQIPGVNVITSTGAPGAGAAIQVRGVSAIGAGGSPLYVVDGFPISPASAQAQNGFTLRNPLNDIPMNDIESITVLKDASAAAIYGSRAANGVVIITTKRGAPDAGVRVDISAYTGVQQADFDRFPDLANATEFATFMNRRWRQLNPTSPLSDMPAEWQNPASYGEGTDWFREVMQTAPTQELNASISGGTGRIRSYFSGGYYNQTGILLNSGFQRFSLRANLESDLSSRLTVGLNLAPSYTLRTLAEEGGNARGGGFGSTQHVWPTDSPYDEDGNLKPQVWGWVSGRTQANPIIVLNERQNDQSRLRALGSAFLNYEILDGVALRTSANVDWADTDTEVFNPSTIWAASGPSIPSGSFNTGTYLSLLNENTLTIDRNIGESQRLQLLGGFTAQQERSTGANFNGARFPDDDIRTLNAAETITGNTSESEWSMASVLGRANYTLLDRYILTGTIRADGSSRFGADNRWGTFPSAALAWVLSREGFMQGVDFLDEAKLRFSLGYTGNNQIGDYPSLGVVNRADYLFNNVVAAGRQLSTLQNPELGWERSREVNIGLDAAMFGNRVSLVADVYQRKTEDLLLSLELPIASGFGSVVANQGAIQNRGLEVGLNTINVDNDRFRWSSNFNVSVNRNKALDLGASDTLRTGTSMEGANTHLTVVGGPVGLFYGYRIMGVYSAADIADPSVAKFAGAVESDPKFKDVNGDGIIRQTEDFEVIGSPYPDFTWGFTNMARMGAFDLRLTVDGAVGGQRLNRNLATVENIDGPFNVTRKYVENMWISRDSIGDGFTPGAGGSSTTGRRMFRDVSNRWVEDAGYVWIRNIALGYTLPPRLTFNARRARLNFNIQNAWVFSDFNGNPQTQSNQLLSAQGSPNSPNLTPGVDNFSYPLARVFTVGIDLGL